MSGIVEKTKDEKDDENLAAAPTQPISGFLRLPDHGRKTLVSMLELVDMVRLDTAMVHREGRVALMEAFQGVEVYGAKIPFSFSSLRYDMAYGDPEELAAGLQWAENKGIIAREFALDIGRSSSSVLMGLITRQRRAMARMLLTRCTKSYAINIASAQGFTPLMNASRLGEVEITRLLCERDDIHLETRDNEGWTALHVAACKGHTECMRALLDRGANLMDVSRYDDATVLHSAVNHGHVDAAILLIERGADLTLLDMFGQSPLDLADKNEDEAMIAYLVSVGALRGEQLSAAAA